MAGAVFLGVTTTRQIDTIAGATQLIVKGDLTQRLPAGKAGGDIERLARVVNAMLDEIERLMHEVKGVCDNIAHDMRTPLTRLLAGLERARRKASTVPDYRASVDEAIDETNGILKTFNALLRISEVEDGVRRSGFIETDLAVIAGDAVEFFEPAAEQRGIDLRFERGAGPFQVSGDPDLLFEAIGNLVDNSLKFTPRGGSVIVRLEREKSGLLLAVEDTGPGIPEDELDAVLRRFHRAERSRTAPGNGLGLSLVAAIARLHSVQLTLSNIDPGCRVALVFDAAAVTP